MRKVLPFVFVALLALSMFAPCYAATTSNDLIQNADDGVFYEPYLLWDTFGFSCSGYEFSIPFPYQSVGFESSEDTVYPQVWTDIDYPNKEAYTFMSAAFSASRTGTYARVDFTCAPDNISTATSMSQSYTLSSSTPWAGNVVQTFGYLRSNALFAVPSGATATYSAAITLLVPTKDASGISELQELSFVYTPSAYTNSTTSAANVFMFPSASVMFGDSYSLLSTTECIVTSVVWTVDFQMPLSSYNFVFRMPIYATGQNTRTTSFGSSVASIWERYPNVVVQTVGDIDFTGWLATALGGFWNSEFYPGFTFGGVAAVLVGLACLIAFMKWFMGG